MNKLHAAVGARRAVIAVGGKAMSDGKVLAELSRLSGTPQIPLGGDPAGHMQPLSADAVAAATDSQGGIVLLLEPNASVDGQALGELASLLGKGRNKPRVYVVTKAYNPFMLPMGLRTLKLENVKAKVRDFLEQLPSVAPAARAVAPTDGGKKKKKRSGPSAPRTELVGREAELPALKELVAEPGPLLIHGAAGIGKRWLLESALSDAGLERAPDLVLGRGVGFDTFTARLAEWSGDEALKEATKRGSEVPPVETVARAVTALGSESLAGKVMVVDGLISVQNRDGAIHKNDRLGLLIRALLTSPCAGLLVFLSPRDVTFFRAGQDAALRRMAIGGLKGKELFGIFEAYHAEECERENMGPLHNAVNGHPMAARAYAVTWRDTSDPKRREGLFERKKMPRVAVEGGHDIEPLVGWVRKRLEKLPKELREALAAAAHTQVPMNGRDLATLGINRDTRIQLQRRALLDALPGEGERRYRVHPVVAFQLTLREVSQFDRLERMAQMFTSAASSAEGLEQLALKQAANHAHIGCRHLRSVEMLDHVDADALVESVYGLLRGKQPRVSMARERINIILKVHPVNTEAWQLRAEAAWRDQAKLDKIVAIYEQAERLCPTLELFHHHCTMHLDRKRGRPDAITVLERGAEAFPDDARIRRRLARLLMEEGKDAEAEAVLRRAMELEPQMPDTYSLLGRLVAGRGGDSWQAAEELLREAITLDPEGSQHKARLGGMLRLRGLGDAEQRDALWGEARELLEAAVRDNERSSEAALELALLLLDMGVEHERVQWLLKKRVTGPETSTFAVALVRLYVVQGKLNPAEQKIRSVLKKHGMDHAVHAANAELLHAQKRIFLAAEELKKALAVAPPDAPQRTRYQQGLDALTALITSGEALRLEKEAEEQVLEANTKREEGARRDPGSTTKLRKKKGAEAEVGAAPEAAPELPSVGEEAPAPEAAPEAEVAPDAAPAAEE